MSFSIHEIVTEEYREWLKQKRKLNTALGDLARDYIADGEPSNFSWHYLLSKGACFDAIDTFKQSIRTFKAYQRRKLKTFSKA